MADGIDLQGAVTTLLSIASVVLGWLARELWEAVKSLRKDLSDLGGDLAALEVRMSRDYVSYDRLRDALEPVMTALGDIKQALRDKQDKP